MEDIVLSVLGGSLLIAFFVLFTVLSIKEAKAKKDSRTFVAPSPEELFESSPEVIELHGEIVDLSCSVGSVGMKMPKTVKCFFIHLKEDSGELHRIPVAEEIYDAFEIGQVGTLTLIDGITNTFVLDGEEASE